MTAPDPRRSRARRSLAPRLSRLLLVWSFASCAPPEPPESFAFPTNHDPAAALRCAVRRLRVEGFEVTEPADSAAATVALRRVESGSEVGAGTFWRIELRTTHDDEGRTVVQSLAGTAPRSDGPYAEPSTALQGVIGRVSAACTW